MISRGHDRTDMSGGGPGAARGWRLVALDEVFEEISEHVDYYAWIGDNADYQEATQRLTSLVARTLQRLAEDVADGLSDAPGLTATAVHDELRRRAAELDPGSARFYQPEE